MSLKILLVEDEPALLVTLAEALTDAGHEVTRAATGTAGAALLRDRSFDLLVTDIRLPGVDGCALAGMAHDRPVPVPVVLMTAFGQVDQAVAMMKRGALDYLSKPIDEAALVGIAHRIARARTSGGAAAGMPVAQAPRMVEALRLAAQVAASPASVLLTGETGVGKEVIARFIHRTSPRASAPFIGANCASIPPSLIEAELFGHTRGAYTGAQGARLGWVRSADKGTLLLDEVGELSPAAQASLLRVLEERAVQPVGADKPIPVDFRLIAATHRDLDAEQERGAFRSDLYYRLCAFEIRIPPLRERLEDLAPLIQWFLNAMPAGTAPSRITPAAADVLAAYPWPGNVRELRNSVEHACILAGTQDIQVIHLPRRIQARVPSSEPLALRHAIERVEEQHIRRALALSSGGRQRAADMLAISRKHLWELMKRYGIEAPEA